MRAALLLALLTGCPPDTTECAQDSDCGGAKLCTRDFQCLPASEVRAVKILWTVNHAPPNPETCTNMPNLFVEVDGDLAGEMITFAPVPCNAGIFNFDKLPTSYGSAVLGIDGSDTGDRVAIDASNTAQFDLFP